ncbi:hypothetical protein EV121DRAFT_271215 [Schizophyllum commune]
MDITLEPKGLVNEDGLYFLQQQAIADILKYMWPGILLPYLPRDYIGSRIGLTGTHAAELADILNPLTEACLEARANCKTFVDKIYPNIVDLSSYVYGYAQIAGGNTANSRYVAIIKWIKQVEAGDNGHEAVEHVLDNAFDRREEDIQNASDRVTSDSTIVDSFVSKLRANRSDMRNVLGNYEHDELLNSRTATHAWVSFFGTVSTSAAQDVEGVFAQKLAELADKSQELISNSGFEADLARLLADVNAIAGDLQLLSSFIDQAVDAIHGMRQELVHISEDLRNLNDLSRGNPMQAINIVSNLNEDQLIRHWNGVKDAVDTYRQIAFGPAATTITLENLASLLRQHATK